MYTNNTVYANEIEHIVCKKDKNDLTNYEYFTVKAEESLYRIKLRQLKNVQMEEVNIIYLPVNGSVSTTGHKLQGKIVAECGT